MDKDDDNNKTKAIKYPDFNKHSLIPAIIQDFKTNKVLMLGYMSKEAYELTLNVEQVHFFSRSRNRIWKKGETSGNIQQTKNILFDCDNDTLLIKVEQIGGASCHNGYVSCFYKELKNKSRLENIEKKVFDPSTVYKD